MFVPFQSASTFLPGLLSFRGFRWQIVGFRFNKDILTHSLHIAIDFDASDPDIGLNSRLRELGPVTPSPTLSNSSTFNRASAQDPTTSDGTFVPSASTPSQSIYPTTNNPAVSLLTARYRIAEEAEQEFEKIGRKGFEGRKYLDVATIRTVLVYRSEGMPDAEIERRLELRSGVVKSLGGRVVSVAGL